MTQPFDWDLEYRLGWHSEALPYNQEILTRIAAPTQADVRWLVEGLRDERRWFIAGWFERAAEVQWLLTRPMNEQAKRVMANCYRGQAFPEVFFQPLMDAGIDECEPSGCRTFVLPCSAAFGAPRSLEYLHDVIAHEGTRRKVGAFLALYHTRGGQFWSRVEVDAANWKLLREREKELALQSFLGSEDRGLRFAALRELSMHLDHYPDRLHALARAFFQAALSSKDKKLRALVQHKMERTPRVFPDTWPEDLTRERP